MTQRQDAGCPHTSRPRLTVKWIKPDTRENPRPWATPSPSTTKLRDGTPQARYMCEECAATWGRETS